MDSEFKKYEYDRNSIIERIKTLRGRKRIDGYQSNEKLAEKLGVNTSTIKRWMNKKGKTEIPTEYLAQMCNLFECDIDYLLGRIPCKTHEATDICDITGLSEEAVNYLSDEKYGKNRDLLVNYLIEEDLKTEDSSLLSEMLLYFLDEINMYWISTDEWFPLFNRIFNRVAPNFGEQQHYVSFEEYFSDAVETFVLVLRELKYSEKEIQEVRNHAEKQFHDYYARLEYRKLNQVRLQAKVISSIDAMVSKYPTDPQKGDNKDDIANQNERA